MASVTLTVRRVAGRIYVRRGKVEYDLGASLSDVREWVRINLPALTHAEETALALRELVKTVATATDLDALVNKTVDVTAADGKVV